MQVLSVILAKQDRETGCKSKRGTTSKISNQVLPPEDKRSVHQIILFATLTLSLLWLAFLTIQIVEKEICKEHTRKKKEKEKEREYEINFFLCI